VAVVEFIERLALKPFKLVNLAGETLRPDLHLNGLINSVAQVFVRLDPQVQDFAPRPGPFPYDPEPAVEQPLACVVAQANELVSGNRQSAVESAPLAQARIVSAARHVTAD